MPSREPATKLLKAVNGNVEDAIRRVRRAVAENVTDLHVVANNPNRYGAAMSSPPARKGDVRLLAQEGESPNIQVGYQ